MRKATGIYMRACRNIANGAAAHDTESWLSGDFVHVAEIVAGSPDARGARILPEPHQISSHVPLGQQRSPAQTGKPLRFSCRVTTYSKLESSRKVANIDD